MLQNLHVKNLALIGEADVYFGDGLHILTGETGAGKSILLGSLNLALGQKVSKDLIRQDADYALVELVFSMGEKERRFLADAGLDADDEDVLIISRRITEGRSTVKINGETVPLHTVQQITRHLLDIHGQHDHQSLLYTKKHLEILDAFGKESIRTQKEKVAALYRQYREWEKEAASYDMDEEARLRECAYLEFVISEIESAALKEGEEAELEQNCRKLQNGKKILETLQEIYSRFSYDSRGSIQDRISESAGALKKLTDLDLALEEFEKQIVDLEALCSDFTRGIQDYMEEFSLDEAALVEMTERLDLIRNLQSKYGHTVTEIAAFCEEKKAELEKLQNYDQKRQEANGQLARVRAELEKESAVLTTLRKQAAKELEPAIIDSLRMLNFLDVRFFVKFRQLDRPESSGADEVEFMISTNPGEPEKPLAKIASGGELSRIMLAIRTILAREDEVDTLIFDEIDAGISGKTAQLVSKQLAQLGKQKQVICITHLPQIAAMADRHYKIEKTVRSGRTYTEISQLSESGSIAELARLLGGETITDAVLKNAKEMKELAKQTKI